MGFSARLDKITNSLNIKVRKTLVSYSERKNIKKKASLISKVSLSTNQEKEIVDYYRKYYGRTIPTDWHRLYQSYTGVYHVDYFPEIIFSTKLEPLLNPYREAEFLGDKNLLDTLFSCVEGVHIPKTYISSVKGILRNEDRRIISLEEAEESVRTLSSFVIKKTKETSSGRDVHVFKGREDPVKLLKQFGENYVVQEVIHQSPSLSKLNPTSVNTFRVITYMCEGKINTCPIALRIGRSNADKDNIHYGGICVGVNMDGSLKEKAFSEFGETFTTHPDTQVEFNGYKVPVGGVLEVALRLHSIIPYLGIVSWDLSLDENDVPTLIEMNTTGQSAWFCQMVNGEPLFGSNTVKMLSLVK